MGEPTPLVLPPAFAQAFKGNARAPPPAEFMSVGSTPSYQAPWLPPSMPPMTGMPTMSGMAAYPGPVPSGPAVTPVVPNHAGWSYPPYNGPNCPQYGIPSVPPGTLGGGNLGGATMVQGRTPMAPVLGSVPPPRHTAPSRQQAVISMPPSQAAPSTQPTDYRAPVQATVDYAPAAQGGQGGQGDPTTVMLRNIPNRYTQSHLVNLLDENGFRSLYDFVYLPMDFRNGVNLGYAFVNLLTHQDALNAVQVFHGFSRWFYESSKVCEVSWAHPHQGLEEHVERYRNSPVMHQCMPDEYKPMLFKSGVRMPFPLPTKAIRAPKLRPIRERPPGEAMPAGM